PGRVETISLPSWPLNRDGGVAVEGADRAAAVHVQHVKVVDVSAKAGGGGIPGDLAGTLDRHDAEVENAAAEVGGVAGQGAAAEGRRAEVEDTAALAVIARGGVPAQAAATDGQRVEVEDAAAEVGGVAGQLAAAADRKRRGVVDAAAVGSGVEG